MVPLPYFATRRLIISHRSLVALTSSPIRGHKSWLGLICPSQKIGILLLTRSERYFDNPYNIAEGNGKTTKADRRRYFEIARGSALECAAIQDVLVVGFGLDKAESQQRKGELDRIAAMHTTYLKIFIWFSGMGLGR